MAGDGDQWIGASLPGRLGLVRPARQRMTQAARRLRQEATASERLLWNALRGGKLEGVRFRRQHPIGPFIVDFFSAAAGLIVEIDGLVHDVQRDHDRARQELLESKGYRVLRFTAQDVERNLAHVLEQIASVLAESR